MPARPLYYICAEEAYDKVMSGEWDKTKFLEWYEDCRRETRNDGYSDGFDEASENI